MQAPTAPTGSITAVAGVADMETFDIVDGTITPGSRFSEGFRIPFGGGGENQDPVIG